MIIEQVWSDTRRDRNVPARIYLPAGDNGPFPLIVFSHGFGESLETYAHHGNFWAGQGYIVAVLNHQGTDTAALQQIRKTRDQSNTPPFDVRPADVSFAIDNLIASESNGLRGKIDASRIAAAGHSMGSSTALSMIGLTLANRDGSRRSFADHRVRCAIAMSMQIGTAADNGGGGGESLAQGLDRKSWEEIEKPAMMMMGTEDRGLGILREKPEVRRIAFDLLRPGDKYLVNIKGVEHHAFTDTEPYYGGHPRDPRHYGWINQATLNFLNAYVRDDEQSLQWLRSGQLRQDTGGEVMWESK